MPFVKSDFAVALDDLLPPTKPKGDVAVKGYRPMHIKSGVFPDKRGSAYVEFGDSRLLAQISGPKESSEGDFHSGAVTINISETVEEEKLRAQLVSALSGTIQLRKYARSLITVDITILHDDGGILQAALLASSLALIHAGIEVFDVILPCHVAVTLSNDFIVDAPRELAQSAIGKVTVAVLPNLNQIVCCDIRGSLPYSQVNEVIAFAQTTSLKLYPAVRKAIVNSIC